MIYRYSELCYNDHWYIAATYRFALRDIVTAISRLNDVTAIYHEDRNDLSLIHRFDVHRFKRYLADLSPINHGSKWQYSAIITCITFAQYCISEMDTYFDPNNDAVMSLLLYVLPALLEKETLYKLLCSTMKMTYHHPRVLMWSFFPLAAQVAQCGSRLTQQHNSSLGRMWQGVISEHRDIECEK